VRRFCYKCGALEKDAGPLIDGLCQRCFLESISVDLPERIELTSCRGCGAFLVQGQWTKIPKEEAVKAEVLRKARLPEGLKLEVELKGGVALLHISGKVHEMQKVPIEMERSLTIREKFTTCRTCSRKKGGYHEAIVQVRGIPPDRISEILRELESRLLTDDEDFITEVVFLENGADVYVSTVSLGRKLSSALKEMGAKISSTSKLTGLTKDGRRRYRVTFLVRF